MATRRRGKVVFYQDKAHQWRWRLVAPNGRVVACGCESFNRRAKAVDGFDSCKRIAPSAHRVLEWE